MSRRRSFARSIPLLVLGTLLLSGASCESTRVKEEHVLNRIGYGPDGWSRERIRAIGIRAYIEEQLQPDTLDDSALEARIASIYPLTTWSLPKVRSTYHEYRSDVNQSQVRADMSRARMLRNALSKRQLEQVLVDFWYNHFNVDAGTEVARWGVVTYEREAIRPHVLGRFRDMLGAVAAHPAMLEYLDNAQNFIPGFRRGTSTFGPNENYARELLELHTLGVDAGYTLQDIQEIARAFTGWTINQYLPSGQRNYFEDSFVYEDAGHDKSAKSIMGELYIPAGGGMEEGHAVLDFLAQHPATAHFIASKLVQRFVSDVPPAALVDQVAAEFLATDGDLYAVTRAILLSSEFNGSSYRRAKVKRPQHFVASLARAVGVADESYFAERAAREAALMGEEIYAASPPTGYPEHSSYWLGEGPFIFRINVAFRASYGQWGWGPKISSPFVAEPSALVDDLARRFVLGNLAKSTADLLSDFSAQIPASKREAETAAAIFVSPEFLVH